MPRAEPKTVPTEVSVEAYLAAIDDPRRQADARTVTAMMQRVTGHPPTMWGQAIVGFGSYHYRYASGHEGDAPEAGFSSRKAALTLYTLGEFAEQPALLAKLGKFKTAKVCLYVKSLADVDLGVLEQLVRASVKHTREHLHRP
jgi:hypothetical protein